MCIRNLIRLWCPCDDAVHYLTDDNDDDDDHTIRPDSWEAFADESLGHVIVRSIDTGAYIRCNDYLAAHGFNLSGYPAVPSCPTGELNDESTHFHNPRFCDECVSRGCPALWKPESRYGYATTEAKHAARKIYQKKQSAIRAPIRRAQRAAEAAWKWARHQPLRTIDLDALDRAEIAQAKEARSITGLVKSSDEAADTKTAGAVSRSSTSRKGRSADKGRAPRPRGRMFSSVTFSSDDDGDDENESVSATSTPPSRFDSPSSASGPRPACTLRGKSAKKFIRQGPGEEAKKRSRRARRRPGASIASRVADIAVAVGQDGVASETEMSSADGEGEGGSPKDFGVGHDSKVEGVQTLDWDGDTESARSCQTPAVEEVAMALTMEGTSAMFNDTTSSAWEPVPGKVIGYDHNPFRSAKHADLPSTDDEGYHTQTENLDVSTETNPAPSCSSPANTTLSTPTALLSPNPLNSNPSSLQQDNRDTQPEQQLSAKGRGKLPWNYINNLPPFYSSKSTQPSPSPSPSYKPTLSAKARGKLPLFSYRYDAKPQPRPHPSNKQP